jgi:hypothetical protein
MFPLFAANLPPVVVDTGGNLLPVSLIPAANYPNVIFRGLGGRCFMKKKALSKKSVAVCLSRIRICSIPDPGSASKNLSILTQKNGI